jgi:hypothetical protein
MWTTKDSQTYDKIICKQLVARLRGANRKNPSNVACPYRLTFAFSGDGAVPLEAVHLAMVCAGKRLSDWAGHAGKLFDCMKRHTKYQSLLNDLRVAWSSVYMSMAIGRGDLIDTPAITAVVALIVIFLESSYIIYRTVMDKGLVREEELANVQRQLDKLRLSVYFVTFTCNWS